MPMAIETDEDRLSLLTTFGEDVIVDPEGGAVTIKAIFDAGFITIDEGLSVSIESPTPTLLVRDSDIVGLTQGTVITRAGTSYAVSSKQPDGTGLTVLEINKQ